MVADVHETPAGTARAEDPLGKALFIAKLAEAVPAESECTGAKINNRV